MSPFVLMACLLAVFLVGLLVMSEAPRFSVAEFVGGVMVLVSITGLIMAGLFLWINMVDLTS